MIISHAYLCLFLMRTCVDFTQVLVLSHQYIQALLKSEWAYGRLAYIHDTLAEHALPLGVVAYWLIIVLLSELSYISTCVFVYFSHAYLLSCMI